MKEKIYNILLLCTGNSARSIMAEAVLNRLGLGRFRTFSTGSQPAGQVNDHAIQALKFGNYLTDDLRSKDWTEFVKPDAPKLDFVFTVCDKAAEATCPVWPGQPMTSPWGLSDPALFEGSEAETRAVFADTLRMLTNRIAIFVSLLLASLDKLSLQKELDCIGTTTSQATKENAATVL